MAGLVSNVVFVVFCTGGLGLVGVRRGAGGSCGYRVLGDGWGVPTMASRAGSEPRQAHTRHFGLEDSSRPSSKMALPPGRNTSRRCAWPSNWPRASAQPNPLQADAVARLDTISAQPLLQISLRRSVRFPPRGLGAWLACLANLLRGCWAQMRRHLVCAVHGRQMLSGPLKN